MAVWKSDERYTVTVTPLSEPGRRPRWRVWGYYNGCRGDTRYEHAYSAAEAQDMASALWRSYRNGFTPGVPMVRPRTLGALLDAWHESDLFTKDNGRRRETTRSKRLAAAKLLVDKLGEQRSPGTVTTQDVREYVNEPDSYSWQRKRWSAVHAMYEWALSRGFVNRNPASGDTRPRYEPPPDKYRLQLHEYAEILRVARPDTADTITVMVHTGMRIGELSRMRWAWIKPDRDGRWIIQIPHRDDDAPAKCKNGSWMPKTDNSAKRIACHDDVIAALKRAAERWGWSDEAYVFPGTDDASPNAYCPRGGLRPRSTQMLSKAMKRAFRDAGLPDKVTSHALRHLGGAVILSDRENGSMERAQAFLRHKHRFTTEGTYAYLLEEAGVVDMLSSLDALGQARPGPRVRSLPGLGLPSPRGSSPAREGEGDLPDWLRAVPASPTFPGHKGAAAPSSSPARKNTLTPRIVNVSRNVSQSPAARAQVLGTAAEPSHGAEPPSFSSSPELTTESILRSGDTPAKNTKKRARKAR